LRRNVENLLKQKFRPCSEGTRICDIIPHSHPHQGPAEDS
jgi:hypothetical protein